MTQRMEHPAVLFPEVTKIVKDLYAVGHKGGVPGKTLILMQLRASQINGCGFCMEGEARMARQFGETDERLFTVAGWRESPYFSDAERAALALTEAVTRLSDRPDPVPDAIWDEAAKHYDEKGLASLLLTIATVNVFHRLNIPVRLQAGTPMPVG